MDIDNKHKNFVFIKVVRVVPEIILADRQTHRQTHSSQYFATAPAGEVTSSVTVCAMRTSQTLQSDIYRRYIAH